MFVATHPLTSTPTPHRTRCRSGELLGVTSQLKPEQRDSRHILCHMLKQVRCLLAAARCLLPCGHPLPATARAHGGVPPPPLWQVVAWKKLNTEPEAMVRFKTLNGMPL